jgi:bifunctional UDP-N-acetylglucosamine pyrophosphorylase/glucosamine-1-phosphate N-acetyltransferase
LVDTVVGDGAIVENCVSRSAEIGAGAHLGAYSVLEPGDRVPAGVRTGPFYTQARSG